MDIIVTRRLLTDGSPVFDVVFGNQLLPAITEDEAFMMAEKFRDAIGQHTNSRATVKTDY